MRIVSHDSETPAEGQQVITASAFIWHEFAGVKKVFLARRADTKKFLPGLYEPPGGHIDFGEEITDGLKREIAEELNMTIKVGDPFAVFTYQNTIKGSHSVEVIYFAKFVEPIEQVSIQPEDHSSYDWFTKEEVRLHRSDMMSTVGAIYKPGVSDAEYRTILTGFDLLAGGKLDFAN